MYWWKIKMEDKQNNKENLVTTLNVYIIYVKPGLHVALNQLWVTVLWATGPTWRFSICFKPSPLLLKRDVTPLFGLHSMWTCCWIGYVFLLVGGEGEFWQCLSYAGKDFILFFVWNRIKIPDPQRHPYTLWFLAFMLIISSAVHQTDASCIVKHQQV